MVEDLSEISAHQADVQVTSRDRHRQNATNSLQKYCYFSQAAYHFFAKIYISFKSAHKMVQLTNYRALVSSLF